MVNSTAEGLVLGQDAKVTSASLSPVSRQAEACGTRLGQEAKVTSASLSAGLPYELRRGQDEKGLSGQVAGGGRPQTRAT